MNTTATAQANGHVYTMLYRPATQLRDAAAGRAPHRLDPRAAGPGRPVPAPERVELQVRRVHREPGTDRRRAQGLPDRARAVTGCRQQAPDERAGCGMPATAGTRAGPREHPPRPKSMALSTTTDHQGSRTHAQISRLPVRARAAGARKDCRRGSPNQFPAAAARRRRGPAGSAATRGQEAMDATSGRMR